MVRVTPEQREKEKREYCQQLAELKVKQQELKAQIKKHKELDSALRAKLKKEEEALLRALRKHEEEKGLDESLKKISN